MSKRLPIIVILAWTGTTVLFFAHSMIFGGAAITGKIVGGHYYLGSHGNYPEVSRGVYVLSAILSAAFGLSLPVFAGVMTWHESHKPRFNPLVWIGPLLAVVAGLAACYVSIRCIMSAYSGV
jgi:hypothetical protein